MNKKEEYKKVCYKCLYDTYKDQIVDREKFDWFMRGNTMALLPCDRCGKSECGILPEEDIKRAVRASQGQYISHACWD